MNRDLCRILLFTLLFFIFLCFFLLNNKSGKGLYLKYLCLFVALLQIKYVTEKRLNGLLRIVPMQKIKEVSHEVLHLLYFHISFINC